MGATLSEQRPRPAAVTLRLPRLDARAFASVEAVARALVAADPGLDRLIGRRYELASRLPVEAGRRPTLLAAALVADAGRLAVGRAGPAERESVAVAVLGAELLAGLGGLSAVAGTIRSLRERWDGAGGPDGLEGARTPLEARALAVADLTAADMELGARDRRGRAGRLRTGRGASLDPVLADQLAARLLHEPAAGTPPPTAACLQDLRHQLGGGIATGDAAARLAALTATVRAIGDQQRLLTRFCVEALDAVGATTLSVGRFEAETDELVVLVHTGDLEPGDEVHPVDERYPRAALPDFGPGGERTRLVALSRSGLDDPHVGYLRRRGLSAEASTPITVDGRCWGSVWITSRPPRPELGSREVALLEEIAADLAEVVATAERVDRLERLAFRDPLTGLGNRRVLVEALDSVFARPVEERLDVALVMCDVDGLKIVNDTDGHEAGDRVLLDAADALRRATADHPGAMVCRIGGDEFCILLDGGGALHGRPLADRAAASFQRTGPTRSISCGVAVVSPAMARPGELLRAADVAQYEEKRRRQQLGLAPERPTHPPGRGGRRARRDR